MLLDITRVQQHSPSGSKAFALVFIHYLPHGGTHGWIDIRFPISGFPSGVYRKVADWEVMKRDVLQGIFKRDPTMAAEMLHQ